MEEQVSVEFLLPALTVERRLNEDAGDVHLRLTGGDQISLCCSSGSQETLQHLQVLQRSRWDTSVPTHTGSCIQLITGGEISIIQSSRWLARLQRPTASPK